MEEKFWALPLIAALFLSACPTRPVTPLPNTPQAQTPQATPQDECANLTQQEALFAMQLSNVHRHIFCSQFTPLQRAEAMSLATSSKTGGQTKVISPDEAVETVLQGLRGNTAAPPPPSKAKQPNLNIMK